MCFQFFLNEKNWFLLRDFMVNLFKFMARTFLIESVSEWHAVWRGSRAVGREGRCSPRTHRHTEDQSPCKSISGMCKVTVPQFPAKFILSEDIIFATCLELNKLCVSLMGCEVDLATKDLAIDSVGVKKSWSQYNKCVNLLDYGESSNQLLFKYL